MEKLKSSGHDVTYRCESLFSVHANWETIGRQHLVNGDDYRAVSVDSSLTPGNVVEAPMLYTSHLAQYVFEKFGLDSDAIRVAWTGRKVPFRPYQDA